MNRAPRNPEEIDAGSATCPRCDTIICLENEKEAWQAAENWRQEPIRERKDRMGWTYMRWINHCNAHSLSLARAFLLRKPSPFDY